MLAAGICSAAGVERVLTCLQLQAEADIFDSHSFWAEYPEDDNFSFPCAAVRLFERGQERCSRLDQLLVTALEETLAAASWLAETKATVSLLTAVPNDLSDIEAASLTTAAHAMIAQMGLDGVRIHLIRGGREAFAAVLQAATPKLAGGEFVLAAAVDSQCGPDQLKTLNEANRLLAGNPEGLIPGEAAACVLLGPVGSNDNQRVSHLLTAVSSNGDNTGLVRHQRKSLTAVFDNELMQGMTAAPTFRVYFAGTGEGFTAQDLNHTYLRWVEWWPEPLDVFDLATVLGDTGTAAGLVQLIFADFQLQRAWSEGVCRRVLVLAAADADAAGLALLQHG